jgi:NADPH2:quinone reductase
VQAESSPTDGRGVDVAYDGIGGTTLACVRSSGMVVSIGQAGAPMPPLNVETSAHGAARSLPGRA